MCVIVDMASEQPNLNVSSSNNINQETTKGNPPQSPTRPHHCTVRIEDWLILLCRRHETARLSARSRIPRQSRVERGLGARHN